MLKYCHLTFFIKKLFDTYHTNCSRVIPSFSMRSGPLGAPTVLNQMRFAGNFAFGKLLSISKKVCPQFSKKASLLVLLQKKISRTSFCGVLL